MNILLSNTYYQERVEYTSLISVIPPLDLAYCAALLRIHEPPLSISIIDANVERLSGPQLCQRISNNIPDVLIMTAATHSIDTVREVLSGLSQKPDTTILIGTHGTALPEATLRDIPNLDIIVCGEPEQAVLEIVACGGKKKRLFNVPGIYFRSGKGIVKNIPRLMNEDLDALPFPARDLLSNKKYFSPYSPNVTAIQTTRGCAGQCNFCDSHLLYGCIPRMRNPQYVVNEMEECVRLYGTRYFAIIDHTFTAQRVFVKEVCEEIIRRLLNKKILWVCNTRVDLLDDDMLALMKKAGCLQIGIGIESGEDKRLEAVRKGITQPQIKEAIKRIKKHKILAMGYAIIGFPEDTREDIIRTKELIFDFNPHTIQLSFATPLPGTELYQTCKQENRILSTDWKDYVFLRKLIIRNDMLAANEIETMRRGIVSDFYFRASKIIELFLFFITSRRVNYLHCAVSFLKIVTNIRK